ncbi:PKD-like family lipoprotein [Sphingobacterium oryzagri]|uniref:PKD-like family lipoprotein n=1 Tax=Sphingobacterium oryzagri TaxID=3025669 RepID=A0ABY7WFV3_9SPHI|nr:PKD-like family lipoprotein [Sphingobacterium sp. KACC 22765]WDF68402.1 PKD-like family lipoprotein [Sphingobacterium sp. KACC 22765]
MKAIKISIISCLILLSGCYKDNNNYTVNPINEVRITTSADAYAVQQLSTLSIRPQLSYSLDSTDSYSYEWKIFTPNSSAVVPYSEILATTKDLNEIIYSPAREYNLIYTVINNRTGVRYFKEMRLTVNSGFYEGLVVAYNNGNQGELGFIRADNEVALNLMQAINDGPTDAPILRTNTLIVGSIGLLNLTTRNNHYQIDVNEFRVLRDKSTLFSSPINQFSGGFLGANKLSFFDVPSDIYYITNGHVYADMGIDFAGAMANMYSQSFYYTGGDYNLFPFIFDGSGGTPIYFYDNLSKRLLQATYNGRSLSNVTRKTADVYDPGTINKTAVAAMAGYGSTAYFIMHDESSRYYVYTMSRNTTATANNILEVNLSAVPQFANARIFDSRDDQRLIYYAVGNQLYMYNLTNNSASVVLSFSGNEQIADIQVYRPKLWQNSTYADANRRLYVATNNGQTGKVYQYRLEENGSVHATPDNEYTGFGAIVNIDYRNPNE